MKQPVRLEHPSPTRRTLQTRRLIADIKRVVDILNSDIAEEEALAGVFDRSRAEYPILARVLAARKENLQSTAASLQQRLDNLSATASFPPAPAGAPRKFSEMV
jgi:hypothetical protein